VDLPFKTICLLSILEILYAKSHGGVFGFIDIRISDVPDDFRPDDPVLR
jgi:hypothetical protein